MRLSESGMGLQLVGHSGIGHTNVPQLLAGGNGLA